MKLHKNERDLVILIFCKLRRDFVSEIVKIRYLFAVHVHDEKELKMFQTNWPNCSSNNLEEHFCTKKCLQLR